MHPDSSFHILKTLPPSKIPPLADLFGIPHDSGRLKRLARACDALPRQQSEYDPPIEATFRHLAWDRIFVGFHIDRIFESTDELRAFIVRLTKGSPESAKGRSRAELLACLQNYLLPPMGD